MSGSCIHCNETDLAFDCGHWLVHSMVQFESQHSVEKTFNWNRNLPNHEIINKTFYLKIFNPITVDNYAAFFNCTPVGRASDAMMAPT